MCYVLLYSKDFDALNYQINFVVILYVIMNLILFVSVISSQLPNGKNKKIFIGMSSIFAVIIIMYYAVLPLTIYAVMNNGDKKITTVLFDKKEFPNLADETLAVCQNDQFCYINVVKFRVYPTHGSNIELNISPYNNYSIIIRPMSIKNIQFALTQVILRKN